MKPALLTAFLLSSLAVSIHAQPTTHWVGSWAASQQVPEPANALPPDDLRDATLRQIVHLSVGGDTLRVHLSNAFGTTDLHLTSVHIASPLKPNGSAIDPATDRALRFSGSADVVIPPGAEYISDPIQFPAKPLSDLAISIHLDTPPAQQTGHPGSRATSYVAPGNFVSAAELTNAKKIEHWYMLSGVDVAADAKAFSIVALGDSITDGHGATTNGNDRWPDVLARLLANQEIGVLNQGIGGNHLLTDGLGPNVLARFDRDVLAQTAVRFVIVLEGINDLGGLARMTGVTTEQHAELVRRMIGSYEQVIERAHAHGLKVIGATILPDAGSDYYHPDASNEADRQKVNDWIRAAGHFDAVVDLDKLMADPQNPTHLLPAYDSGDDLHPGPAGYKVMGQAFTPSLFAR